RRGFAAELDCTQAQFLKAARGRFWQQAPVQEVRLSVESHGLQEVLSALPRTPVTALTIQPTIEPTYGDTRVVAPLAVCPEVAQLQRLGLSRVGFLSSHLPLLVSSPHLAKLTALDVNDAHIGEGIVALVRSSLLATLRSLTLERCVGEEQVQRLCVANWQ